jgi:hypothetical protein
MNTREGFQTSLGLSDMLVRRYLGDLTDAELLVRPVPGANHIAWQLGHLISSEHGLTEAAGGTAPPLPEGFKEKHAKPAAAIDDPAAFYTKDEYLKLYEEVRKATIATLNSLKDEDFDKPSPERLRNFVPTIGSIFALQGQHWTMHAGQWVVTRRKLGRPPLF